MRLLPLVDKISLEESSSPWVAPYVVLSCFILRKASLEIKCSKNMLNPGFFLLVNISNNLRRGLSAWRMEM